MQTGDVRDVTAGQCSKLYDVDTGMFDTMGTAQRIYSTTNVLPSSRIVSEPITRSSKAVADSFQEYGRFTKYANPDRQPDLSTGVEAVFDTIL